MPWTLIDSAEEGDATFELYAKDGTYMIRANGLELMNGFNPESEIALGQMAAKLAPADAPRVLIGGLGLGYTAATVGSALGATATVTVAEFSRAVIEWFERHVRASVAPVADLQIVHADVADLLMPGRAYDVIVLDVDNGPEPLVTAGNAALYSETGLRRLGASLADGGAVLLWSGFESDKFAAAAEAAGFAVTCEPFHRARAEHAHYIYVLRKAP